MKWIPLLAALAPADGASRNVIGGISGAHLGSPQSDAVAAWTDAGRLSGGLFWVTEVAAGGVGSSQFPALVNVRGDVIVQTIEAGRGYRVQGAGSPLVSAAFEAVR